MLEFLKIIIEVKQERRNYKNRKNNKRKIEIKLKQSKKKLKNSKINKITKIKNKNNNK
jgi:hypothetical protein